MPSEKLTTLLEIIKYSAGLLAEKNIKDPRLNIELMFCEILKCDRIKLYLDFDKPLNSDEISEFKIMLKRRLKFEPLQYIIGKTNFFGYTFNLNDSVLIPRQETEILVEKVLRDIYKDNKEIISILEIGTGSGCITIALSKEMDKKGIKYRITAIDKSDDAILIAKDNLNNNFLPENNINFRVSDFLSDEWNEIDYDYIVSNPPYISLNDIENLDSEIKNYEPIHALTDGKDGLQFYHKIFNLYEKNSNNKRVYLEIGDKRKSDIEGLLIDYNIKNYYFYKDYNNLDRILKIG